MNVPERLIDVVYVTSSAFKIEENQAFVEHARLDDGTAVKDRFRFKFRSLSIKEDLEVNLDTLVRSEVVKAYEQIRVPCIVEHAGLVFEEYLEDSYPVGLSVRPPQRVAEQWLGRWLRIATEC